MEATRLNPAARLAGGVLSLVVGTAIALVMAADTALTVFARTLGSRAGYPTTMSWILAEGGALLLGWVAACGLIAGGVGLFYGRDAPLRTWKVISIAAGVLAGGAGLVIQSVTLFTG